MGFYFEVATVAFFAVYGLLSFVQDMRGKYWENKNSD